MLPVLLAQANQGQSGAPQITSPTFTPPIGRLFCWAGAWNDAHTSTQSWTVTGGGLTWDRVAATGQIPTGGQANYGGRCELWTTTVTAPAQITMSVQAFVGGQNAIAALAVFAVEGDNTIAQVSPPTATGYPSWANQPTVTATLPTTPSPESLVLGLFAQGLDAPGAFATPAGTTMLVSQSQIWQNVAVFHRTGGAAGMAATSQSGDVGNAFAFVVELESADDPPPELATSGTVGLSLGLSGRARKRVGTSGGLSLSLAASSADTHKTAHASGETTAELDIEATSAKTAEATGAVATRLDLAGHGIKQGEVTGEVSLAVATEAVASAHKISRGVLALALDLQADTIKASAVTGMLGLTLDTSGTGRAVEDGRARGHLALALALAASAVKTVQERGEIALTLSLAGTTTKHARSTGSLALDLFTAGTSSGEHPDTKTTGAIGLELALTGTARKHASTLSTLDLVVGLIGIVRSQGLSIDPCRTHHVEPETRTRRVDAEIRTLKVAAVPRVLTVEPVDRTLRIPTDPRTLIVSC